ncbi:hypothetical protein ES703_38111 [subsurface metagenome]
MLLNGTTVNITPFNLIPGSHLKGVTEDHFFYLFLLLRSKTRAIRVQKFYPIILRGVMRSSNHYCGSKFAGNQGKRRCRHNPGVLTPGAGSEQTGDEGVFQGIAGSPGITTHDHITINLPDSQSNLQRQEDQTTVEKSPYARCAKKPHFVLILLL